MKKAHGIRKPVSALAFALIWAVQTCVLSLDVKDWLDRQTQVQNGGLPYALCFLLSGLSVSALALYSAKLSLSKWDSQKFIQAIKATVIFSASSAVLCTAWFIVKTQLMNPTGILGLAVALSTALWVTSLCDTAQKVRES